MFGNRRFRNYEHFGNATKDATYTAGGEQCPSIGEFAKLRRRDRGGALPPSKHYLDKVHLDIVYGDTISKLGFRYGILLVDHATKYVWFYGMRSLAGTHVIGVLEQFRADAGGLPKQFRCDCDQKLMGGRCSALDLPQQIKDHWSPCGQAVLQRPSRAHLADSLFHGPSLPHRETDAEGLLVPRHSARVPHD